MREERYLAAAEARGRIEELRAQLGETERMIAHFGDPHTPRLERARLTCRDRAYTIDVDQRALGPMLRVVRSVLNEQLGQARERFAAL